MYVNGKNGICCNYSRNEGSGGGTKENNGGVNSSMIYTVRTFVNATMYSHPAQ
jgi:hypothetical protein